MKELPEIVEDYINLILENPNVLSDIKRTQEKEIMYFHIAMYLYKDENTRDKALELYKKIKEGSENGTIDTVDSLELKLNSFMSDTNNNPLEQKYKIYFTIPFEFINNYNN